MEFESPILRHRVSLLHRKLGVVMNLSKRRKVISSALVLSLIPLLASCVTNEKVLWKATSSISIWHYLRYDTIDNYRLYNPESSDCQDIELVYSLTKQSVEEEAGSFLYLIKLEDDAGRVSPVNFGTTFNIFDSGPDGREYDPFSSPSIFGTKDIDYKVDTLHSAICAPQGEYRLVLEDQWSDSKFKSETITIN